MVVIYVVEDKQDQYTTLGVPSMALFVHGAWRLDPISINDVRESPNENRLLIQALFLISAKVYFLSRLLRQVRCILYS